MQGGEVQPSFRKVPFSEVASRTFACERQFVSASQHLELERLDLELGVFSKTHTTPHYSETETPQTLPYHFHHVSPSPRSRHVSQDKRHLHRPSLRQMRRQMSRLRLLRATHYPRAHLRRVLLRQLPEQVRRVRR
jgi:hypothetical protein